MARQGTGHRQKESGELYYRPSATTSPLGVLVATATGVVGGIAAAWAYAYLDLHSPLIYLNIVLVLAFGYTVGAAAAVGARVGKVRSPRVALRVAATVACVSYYCAWVFWLNALLPIRDYGPDDLGPPLSDPLTLWRTMMAVLRDGAWSVGSHDTRINGPILAGVWLGEAAAFFAMALWTAGVRAPRRGYCERCNAWCARPRLLHQYAGAVNGMEARTRLEPKDWSYLQTLPQAGADEGSRFDLEVESCGRCWQTHFLTLTRVFAALHMPYAHPSQAESAWWGEYIVGMVTGEGRRKQDKMIVMDKLRVTAGDVATIQATAPWQPGASGADATGEADPGTAGYVAEEDSTHRPG